MNIKLFGITKEIISGRYLTIDATEAIATVHDLKVWLLHQYPALQNLQSWAIAVDSEYADDTRIIGINSEIALLPPVSGG